MIGAEALLKRSRLFHRPITSQHGPNYSQYFLVCESAAAMGRLQEVEAVWDAKRTCAEDRDAGTADLVLVVDDIQ